MKSLVSLTAMVCVGFALSNQSVEAEKISTNSIFQPRQSSRPNRTLGGATRTADRCGQKPAVKYVGLKNQEPVVAWHLNSSSATQAEFALFDSTGKGIYQSVVPLPNEAKEVAVTLPQNLQGNQEYQWVLSLVCQPQERLQDQTIMGWIELAPVK